MTIGNPGFCLALCLTWRTFRGELQYVGDVREQKIKRWPVITWEIGGVRLEDELYAVVTFFYFEILKQFVSFFFIKFFESFNIYLSRISGKYVLHFTV